jgi:hypothetical protein
MFNVLAAQAPAKFDHLVPPRLSYKVDNKSTTASASCWVTFPAGSAGVGAGSPADSEYERGPDGGGYE